MSEKMWFSNAFAKVIDGSAGAGLTIFLNIQEKSRMVQIAGHAVTRMQTRRTLGPFSPLNRRTIPDIKNKPTALQLTLLRAN